MKFTTALTKDGFAISNQRAVNGESSITTYMAPLQCKLIQLWVKTVSRRLWNCMLLHLDRVSVAMLVGWLSSREVLAKGPHC
jgi:hypothetical protein